MNNMFDFLQIKIYFEIWSEVSLFSFSSNVAERFKKCEFSSKHKNPVSKKVML